MRVVHGSFLIVCGWACSGQPAPENDSNERDSFVYDTRLGLAESSVGGSGCMAVMYPSLTAGTNVVLVYVPIAGGVPAVAEGTLGERLSQACSERLAVGNWTGADPSFHAIRRSEDSIWIDGVSFAIVDPAGSITVNGARIAADIDGDGTQESFRVCSSVEGLHFMVWSGPPLEGVLRWHRYYYAGYDMEPSCTERDVVAIEKRSG